MGRSDVEKLAVVELDVADTAQHRRAALWTIALKHRFRVPANGR